MPIRVFFLTLVLLFYFYPLLPAAESRPGQVQDVFGNALPGVLIRSLDRGLSLVSDGRGRFAIPLPDESLVRERFELQHPDFHRLSPQVTWPSAKPLVFVMVPRERISEEVTVVASSRPRQSVERPVAESVVSRLEVREKLSDNIINTLVHTPGVQTIGKGGYAVVPSIRGLARRRVLQLVDGVRLTGDRAAGTSPSFLSPDLIQRIEVLRSPASVLYGSDAMGGVLQVMTPAFDFSRFPRTLSLQAGGSEGRLSATGTWGWTAGSWFFNAAFSRATAGDFSTPAGIVLHSGYRNSSGILNFGWSDRKRDFSLSYIAGLGRDIGKPERANDPEKFSLSPRDDTQLLNLRWLERGILGRADLQVQLFFNPTFYQVDKINLVAGQLESAATRAGNWGGKIALFQPLAKGLKLSGGVDSYLRSGVRTEIETSFNGRTEVSLPLDGGRRLDTAVFLNLDYEASQRTSLQGGLRYSRHQLQALIPEGLRKHESAAWSGYAALNWRASEWLSAFFNAGRSFRAPGLSELFYSGITGRRRVQGNPGLRAENGLNLDLGLKIYRGDFFLGLYGFHCDLGDLIERYQVNPDLYTYANVLHGSISGAELEFQYFLGAGIRLSGHYFFYRGRDRESGSPLNDVPAPQVLGSVKWVRGRAWLELNVFHGFARNRPGPAEIGNDAFSCFDLKGGWLVFPRLMMLFKAVNLLDQYYYPNADPDIAAAPGRSFAISLQYTFD